VRVATGIHGPIQVEGRPVGALLIGRSSATMQGLTVLVGLIDKDYQGEIQIMVQTFFPPMFVAKGTRIAQLVPLPHIAAAIAPAQTTPRGDGSFGSAGQAVLLTIGLRQRPRKTVSVHYAGRELKLFALLDTGADVSIISEHHWPPSWPTWETGATVAGVGGLTLARKSPVLRWTIEDKVVTCSASILPLPEGVQALIGRDILAQMGMVLTTEYPAPFVGRPLHGLSQSS